MKKGKKGKGGKVSGSVSTSFDVAYDFELFALNNVGEEIKPTSATTTVPAGGEQIGITEYTFSGAIDNFTGGYSVQFTDWYGIWDYERVYVRNPLTLDLTARYLPSGTTLTLLNGADTAIAFDTNGESLDTGNAIVLGRDRIEYVFHSPELQQRGIHEFALFVEDREPDVAGFQLNGKTIAIADATTDLESILDVLSSPVQTNPDDSLTRNINSVRISAVSAVNPKQILSVRSGLDQTTIFIEAEDLVTPKDTYLVENFGAVQPNDGSKTADAMGITLVGVEGGVGTVSFEANDYGLSDTYDLEISYFDENDGEGQLRVLVNETVVGELELNENTSSGYPVEDVRREYVIEDLQIDSSDIITLQGIADINNRGSEWVRIDDLSFSLPNLVTQPVAPILIQAEDLNRDTYLVENFGEITTNDGSITAKTTGISLSGAQGDRGTVDFLAKDYQLSGIYDLGINYFDENDGEAQIQVLVNNEVVDELLLNEQNTGSGFPTEGTRREYVVEDLLIKPEDTIVIRGIADINNRGSEWARIDYLTFETDTSIIFDVSTEM